MDIPDEDNAALAKRRAIQALMKDKTLTPAERNVRMQAIMKGDFTDPKPPQLSGGNKTNTKLHGSMESFGASDLEGGSSSSSDSSYTDEDNSIQGSTRTGQYSRSGGGSKAISRTSKSLGSGSGSGTGTGASRESRQSKVDARFETSENSRISGNTHSMDDEEVRKIEAQKDKQKRLLEIHRNTNLSKSQRSKAMSAVMKTNVVAQTQKTRQQRAIKKMGSINESITVPESFDMTALLAAKQRSLRNMNSAQDELFSLITRLSNDDPTLTDMILEKKGLGDEDVIPIFDAFEGNTYVSTMNMRINRIGKEGCSALASAILDNDSLAFIDLSGNNIGDEGVEDLCKVVPYNTTLTQLNLADNKLGDLSACEIAGSLVDNSSLVHVNLSENFIGDEGALNLFKVLATTNQTLQSLLLRLNSITDVGACALASALIENETLVVIDLGHNAIGNKGGMDLLKVLQCNEIIEEMKLDGNKNIDQEILDEIDQELSYESSSSEGEEVDDGSDEESASSDYSSEEAESASSEDSGSDDDIAEHKAFEEGQRTMTSIAETEMGFEISSDDESQIKAEDPDSAPTGGEAMLSDMPDEDNKALAKRKAVQTVMQDKSLSPVERNKKIQDIMSGKVELPPVSAAKKSETKAPAPAPVDMDEVKDSTPTGGEAMLSDMPDEDNKALAKRKAVQTVMQDKSLSPVERNKKIQDIMSGKVELPPVSAAKKSEIKAPPPAPAPVAIQPLAVDEIKDSTPTGGEAMLSDMPDEDNKALAKRKAVQAVMQDKSLSPVERNKKIQDIMSGKVELPPVSAAKKPAEASVTPAPEAKSKGKKSKPKKTKPTTAPETMVMPTELKAADDPLEKSDISLVSGHNFKRNDSHMSYDYGTPTAIAHDWKQWMMRTHPRTHDNLLDVLLAHKYRLSLKSAPNQSSFRVVAVVFFSRMQGGVCRQERFHVVGSNDEPNSIIGSICAERAALMQLSFVLDIEEVNKVIIVTDNIDPVSPGMMCREFMSSFKHMSDSTPILLGRGVCKNCGLNLSGKACGDANGDFDPDNLTDVQRKLFEECGTTTGSKFPSPHDFTGSVTSLRDLFPYPSLYSGLSSVEAFKFGHKYAASKPKHNPNEGSNPPVNTSIMSSRTVDSTIGSYRQERFDLSMISNLAEDEPTTSAEGRSPSSKPDPPSSALNATLDIMRGIQEGGEYQGNVGIIEMTPEIIHHLVVKTLKVSPRLKSSQQREKLIRLASEATALEIPRSRIHPIRYGAAVLFSDFTVALASQKVGLEYGCTLDAVGQLASAIDKKYIQADEGEPTVKPVLIVMCDQFGIAHAPFAQGRSFLTERGFGDCKILIHQKRSGNTGDAESDDILRLVEISASELAPSPPDIFGTLTSHTGLQIEF